MHIKRNVALFFVVSYALTWFGHAGNWIHPSVWWPVPMNPLGPIMAAPIVIALSGGRTGLKGWLRRLTRFRAPWPIYAFSVLIPLGAIAASISLSSSIGWSHTLTTRDLSEWTASSGGWMFLLFAVLEIPNGPLPEELSFRGYGQHELQRLISPRRAGLWIGVGVLIWHLPVLVLAYIPWPVAIALPAVSIVYAWLYQNGGSLYPLVALHLIQNVVGAGFFGRMFSDEENQAWLGILAMFYVCLAAGLAWKFGASLAFDTRDNPGAEGSR